ncbi:MAG: GNAT family N-acetyltransferase, partial [Crocinitomicaceae bacterium]|nr:GNAT family N-acetyltransferase [Crocinitomicaceae bacterium]
MGFMEYKKATIDHIPVISKLAKEIWPRAYGSIISTQQLDYMLNLIYSPDALKNQIENLQHQFIIA